MRGLKVLFLIGSLFASCHGLWWGTTASQNEGTSPPPPLRHYPVSYIRAFAYHPVAFPQPLAPITTYQVSRNSQSYNPSRNIQSAGMANAITQAFQQRYLQGTENTQQGSQIEYGTQPTTTTTTTTTTPAPTTTTNQPQVFPGSQPLPQAYTRFSDGYQRQLPLHQSYQSGNFGGFPQIYSNQPFNNPFQFNEPSGSGSNQFSGRVFGGEPSYQQFPSDPLQYQFIPTSITQIPSGRENNVKFVPCMCPVSVSIAPPAMVEKRNDEIPILSATPEPETLLYKESAQSLSQLEDERELQ